jgi:hypothetical protein
VSCPAPARLAAAVSGEDAAALAHARDCVTCRGIVEEQRDVIASARMMRVPPLRAEHRAALAAEVMAQTDFEDAQRPWRGERVMAVAASIVAIAAVITIVFALRRPQGMAPEAPSIASIDEPAIESVQIAQLDPVAAPLRAAVVSVGADFARAQHGDVDVVTLHDGVVSVDATETEPVTIVAGDTRVTIASSRVKVIARRGVIVTTHVFAGTAEVSSNGRSQVIDAGDVWMRAPEPTPAQVKAGDSLAAFRVGWEQLRAHHYPQAIAAFDRATDPVVAEDAAFWAAIATERAGDTDGAATRLRAFLERFPTSPRADTARAALERVTK